MCRRRPVEAGFGLAATMLLPWNTRMPAMRVLVAIMVAAVALAGCSDGKGPGDDGFGLDDELQATDTTGVIRGLVVDTAVVPIAGATIQVVGQNLNATSNEGGLFGFSGLTPGSYFLQVSHPLYETVQATAEVVAGVDKPAITKVQLIANPDAKPYYFPAEWSGFLGCTYRRPDRGESCPVVNQYLFTEHDFLVDYELAQVPSWVVSEQIWESTQHFGGEMSFNLRRTDTSTDTKDIEGTSPLSITLNETEIALHGTNNANDNQGGFGPDMRLRVIVFTAHLQETEPPQCLPFVATGYTGGSLCWGVGLQLDQHFTVYTHVFFNYQPPEDWRFLDDTSVPQPPGGLHLG
jgi:hypothetical protein